MIGPAKPMSAYEKAAHIRCQIIEMTGELRDLKERYHQAVLEAELKLTTVFNDAVSMSREASWLEKRKTCERS